MVPSAPPWRRTGFCSVSSFSPILRLSPGVSFLLISMLSAAVGVLFWCRVVRVWRFLRFGWMALTLEPNPIFRGLGRAWWTAVRHLFQLRTSGCVPMCLCVLFWDFESPLDLPSSPLGGVFTEFLLFFARWVRRVCLRIPQGSLLHVARAIFEGAGSPFRPFGWHSGSFLVAIAE